MPKRLTEEALRRRRRLKSRSKYRVGKRVYKTKAGAERSIARRTKLEENPARRSELRDLGEFVGAGFAGYAGTRLLSRVTYVQVAKKSPKWARHASVGASVGAALAAYYLLAKVKKIQAHHLPVSVGAAIAALQTVVQTYVPKFGWIVSDYQPLVGSASAPAIAPTMPMPNLSDDDDDDDIGLDPLSVTLGATPGEKFSVMAGEDEGDDEFMSN